MDDPSDDARNRGPGIPLIFADSPVSLATAELGLTQTMLAEATRFYGGLSLRIGDFLSKHLLKRLRSPYKDEIAAISEVMGQPGTTAMNLSYEWGCTSGVGPDPVARGNRLLRHAIVAGHETSCGVYFNVTWPGYVGVLTAMAPKRFSAAINQPPARCW